jgi:threonine dehydratase
MESESSLQRVSLEKIRAAREVVYKHLEPSPLREYPLLNEEIAARVFLKHENHLPTGASPHRPHARA